MNRCTFITLGCKVNQYETQAIRELVMENGYSEVPSQEIADLYIINTCTVTAVSDNKSKQLIRKTKKRNPQATLIITGCYAESDKETLINTGGVHVVTGDNKKSQIADILGVDVDEVAGPGASSNFDFNISHFKDHTRAFIKIEDGCDNHCSYCIVPSVRGGVKSRPIADILNEAERLSGNGYQEIVITGIHLGAYGKDFSKTTNNNYSMHLIEVLKKLEKIKGIARIRLSSIESYEISDDLIELIAGSDKICPHFHLPLQSGDDYILKRMNRNYTSKEFLEKVDKIRNKIENPAFTTDLIVGFPGEEEMHFENSKKNCIAAGFSRIHVFPYSDRKDTASSKMAKHCNSGLIKERKAIMQKVADEMAVNYKSSFINKTLKVLVESGIDKESGMLCGYTERYVKVVFDGNASLMKIMIDVYTKGIERGNLVGIIPN